MANPLHRSFFSNAGLLTVLAAFLLTASPVAAQSFGSSIDARLQRALGELNESRQRIAREKLPLSKSVAQLETEVARLRRERDQLLKVGDSSTLDLNSLKRQVDSKADQDDFVRSRLNEFVRDFEGRLHISEVARFEELTAAAKNADKNANLDDASKRLAKLDVVSAALERIQDLVGGQIYAGGALSPTEKVLTPGKFVSTGPTVFFVSDDGGVSGLVEAQLNAADPVVVSLPSNLTTSLPQLAQTGQGVLPFDATLGKALKLEKARKTIGEYIADGGVVGYVILALGAAALALTSFKAVEILGFKVADIGEVDSILADLADGSQEAAAKRASQIEGLAGEMLETGVRYVTESRSVLEELLFEKMLRARPILERFLPFLAITAAAAPLLGLLGTVIGMINTFQLITIFGTGDAKSLSSGISEALMTTALGLVVAIPTLILHGALSRMAKRKLGLLEELSIAFVNGVDLIRGTGQR